MLEWVGWIATGFFGLSYLCKSQATLCRVQAVAASIWVVYGLTIHAMPVVVANVVVGVMALYSVWRQSKATTARQDVLPIGRGVMS